MKYTVCGPVSGQVKFPATFRKSSFLVKNRILMRNDSFQTFIDASSFIISSGGFQVVVEGGNFKFTQRWVNFLAENGSVYGASNYIVSFKTSFYLFACIKRVNFLVKRASKELACCQTKNLFFWSSARRKPSL